MVQKLHFSLRMDASTRRRLEKQAARNGEPKTRLAERYIEEAVRMADHPGIVFREGPAGRRAALAGTRLDVWAVVETVLAEKGNIQRAAKYFKMPPLVIQAAVDYYADYKDEIDAWIDSNAEIAADAQAAKSRSRAAIA